MSSTIQLNLVEGSVRFSFTQAAAEELKREIAVLMDKLKAAAASIGSRPEPQQPMEYRHTGDVFLEVFCNPNIWPSPFAAKVLITVRDERIRLTTEAELTRVIDDLNQFLDQ